MGSSYKSGFTIIETMLFLAITGALVVGVLVGTGASINIQRYRDSVTSLKSLIQKQYSDALNVQNGVRAKAIACDASASVSETGATQPRGQSDCVVMGKLVTIDNTTVTTSTVIGAGVNSGNLSDVDLIKSYNLSILNSTSETSQLEWGTKIAWPVSGGGAKNPTTPREIAILIVRSPQSGQIYTFSADDIHASLKSMIVAGRSIPGQSQRTICIDSDGLFTGDSMAVSLGVYATGASDIETRSNNTNLVAGVDSKC